MKQRTPNCFVDSLRQGLNESQSRITQKNMNTNYASNRSRNRGPKTTPDLSCCNHTTHVA